MALALKEIVVNILIDILILSMNRLSFNFNNTDSILALNYYEK